MRVNQARNLSCLLGSSLRTTVGTSGMWDDIARIAVFLASDDSGWLTGERVVASGGYF
jgi:NAD(P)-dependent dehydrogenase (short-subunit alcohol dehydrogenase family)